MDRRGQILNTEHKDFVTKRGVKAIYPENFPEAYKEAAINAMDKYMRECCLDLLEYLANSKVICHSDEQGTYFNTRGETLTKEQIFENFL